MDPLINFVLKALTPLRKFWPLPWIFNRVHLYFCLNKLVERHKDKIGNFLTKFNTNKVKNSSLVISRYSFPIILTRWFLLILPVMWIRFVLYPGTSPIQLLNSCNEIFWKMHTDNFFSFRPLLTTVKWVVWMQPLHRQKPLPTLSRSPATQLFMNLGNYVNTMVNATSLKNILISVTCNL